MRIVRVETVPLRLRLREPYTIAYETVDTVFNLGLRLVTDTGHVGLGIVAPDEGVTGETPEVAERAIRDVVEPLLNGADPLRRAVYNEPLFDVLPNCPSVRSAVDAALYDLLGKACGVPVTTLLGHYRTHMPTSMTVYIRPGNETVARAREYVEDGFRAIKLKGGVDVEADIERVLAVRAAVGPDVDLRFDANQGYTADQAIHFSASVRSAGLSMLEQPTPADQRRTLRDVTAATTTPVMADESILSLADAFLYARGDAMDMVNLKLVKVGGIDRATLINGVARAAGLHVMVGCMDEAALSIAGGLAFALSRRNVEFADLDGHLDLLDDPTCAAVHLRDGCLYPSDQPGFGLLDFPED
jgi:L-alanine-DL-glutamate epimerase-like enolase superfamily enzyme